MSFVLVTAPTVEPLTASDVRTRLGLGSDVVDGILNPLITAARLKIERQYGIAMITQTLEYVQDRFPGCLPGYNYHNKGFYPLSNRNYDPAFQVGQSDIRIPISPLQSIVSVTYLDSDGVSQTLDPATYVLTKGDLESRLSQAINTTWPTTQLTSSSVKVQLLAGFGGTADSVPETLKTVVTLQVNHLRSLMEQNIFVTADGVIGVGQKSYSVGRAGVDVTDAAVGSLMQDYVRPSL